MMELTEIKVKYPYMYISFCDGVLYILVFTLQTFQLLSDLNEADSVASIGTKIAVALKKVST